MLPQKTSRNEPCQCGSGKKYKHCCLAQYDAARLSASANESLIAIYLKDGIAYHVAGEINKAAIQFEKIIAISSDHPEANYRLGLIDHQRGLNAEAAERLEKVVPVLGESDQFAFNFGTILLALEKFPEAAIQFRKSIDKAPANPDAWGNNAIALHRMGEFEAAGSNYLEAFRLRPDHVATVYNLAGLYYKCGLAADAEACFHHVIRLQPDHSIAYNDALLMAQYSSTVTADVLFARHCEFAAQFETPLKKNWQAHTNLPSPEKRLKIGYVSADLRNHAVAFFLEPMFEHHDRQNFDIFCYHNHAEHDAVSDRLQSHTDQWVVCIDMSDDELAARIRADGIDILIDLSGHTAGNRLLTFARKPAPVQITFNGYPATTGLTAMDYRITDEMLDPVGMSERYHSEKLLRVPSVIIFKPYAQSPALMPLPALSSEFFTFACLNSLIKITDDAIRVWSIILSRKPNSRLMLANVSNPSISKRLLSKFAGHGITADRLRLIPPLPLMEYLSLHGEIDLALDPFPYNGGTTTNHSLWMGVPVLTLRGQRAVSRTGAAVMTSAGLDHFVTHSEEEYIERALSISSDLAALDNTRQSARSRFVGRNREAPLELTRYFEAALRVAWRAWCKVEV